MVFYMLSSSMFLNLTFAKQNFKTIESSNAYPDGTSLGSNQDLQGKGATDAKNPDFIEEYTTNRFIVKYKGSNNVEKIHAKLKDKLPSLKKLNNINKVDENSEIFYLNDKMKIDEFKGYLNSTELNEDIEYVQPDYEVFLSSSSILTELQTNLNSKEILEQRTDTSYGSNITEYEDKYAYNDSNKNSVIVAVLDTGIDITHKDIINNIWINGNEVPDNGIDDDSNGYVDDVNGFNFYDSTNVVYNKDLAFDEWHGTQVSGIILSEQNSVKNNVNPNVKIQLMPLKVFSGGTAYTSDIIKAINYASNMGARVANCSWGTSQKNLVLKDAMQKSNMIFVCAAGNNHINLDNNPVYPGSYDNENIITVASIDSKNKLSSFSNFGQASVDVMAPGEDIVSTMPGNSYGKSSGTSMAAALVTGETANLLAKHKSIQINEIKEQLRNIFSISNYSEIDYNSTYQELLGFELFTGRTWSAEASMPIACSNYGITELNGKIYVIGGYSNTYVNAVQVYDTRTNTWELKASMPTPRSGIGLACIKGKIYVMGGYYLGEYLTTVEEYDPKTNSWSTKESLPGRIRNFGITVLNDKIYAMGGYQYADEPQFRYNDQLYEYDPENDKWTTKSHMPIGSEYMGAAACNGKIYTFGGYNYYAGGDKYVRRVDEYDPALDKWTQKTTMPSPKSGFGITSANGKIYLAGGYYLGSYLNTFEEYDPVKNTWNIKTSMMLGRRNIGIAYVNGKIHAIGGYNGTSLNSVESIFIGYSYKYEYDAAGRLIKKVLPSGKRVYYQYDNNGNLIKSTLEN